MAEYNTPELVEIGTALEVVLGEKSGEPQDSATPSRQDELTVMDRDE